MQGVSLNWVTTYSNTEDHHFNNTTTKMTNLISPKNYTGTHKAGDRVDLPEPVLRF